MSCPIRTKLLWKKKKTAYIFPTSFKKQGAFL